VGESWKKPLQIIQDTRENIEKSKEEFTNLSAAVIKIFADY
jgi:hypothetical protein